MSEFTGISHSLSGVHRVNPQNVHKFSHFNYPLIDIANKADNTDSIKCHISRKAIQNLLSIALS
jgi:hypothetical protein